MPADTSQDCFSAVGVSLEVLALLWAEKVRRGERRLCNSHRTRLQRACRSTQRYFKISQEITWSFCERLWQKCDSSEYISTSSWFIVNAAELSAVTFQLRSFFWVFPDQTRCGKQNLQQRSASGLLLISVVILRLCLLFGYFGHFFYRIVT